MRKILTPTIKALQVVEESTNPAEKTGGNFQVSSIDITIPSGTGWTEQDKSFPFPISLFSAHHSIGMENHGDVVEFIISPDKTIGSITQDVTTSDTWVNVNPDALPYIKIGYFVGLDPDPTDHSQGASYENLGRVLAKDIGNSKIQIENSPTSTFLAADPTYVKLSIKLVHNRKLAYPGAVFNGPITRDIGLSKIGGKYLPANTLLRARYDNIEGSAKDFSLDLEYLY